MDDATQTDAEEVVEPEEESQEKKVSSREEMMAKIVDERELEVISDIIGQEGLEEIEAEESQEEKEEIQQEDPAPPVWLKDGTWVTSVKVNGAETIVPFEGLKVSHQKDSASQQRFEEAAAKERWLDGKEAQLRQYVQSLKQKEEKENLPETQGDEPKTDTNFVEVAKEYHQALYEDDADKAAELLQTLTTGRPQVATPNVEEAVNKALQEAFARQQMAQAKAQQTAYESSVKEAVSWFEKEYPEVAGNSELRAIADNRTVTIMKDNPSMAPGYVIQAAAEYAREWANQNLSTGKSNERVDRKKKIVSEPKTARKSAKIGEDEPVEKTPSQVIDEMRESRGQQQL